MKRKIVSLILMISLLMFIPPKAEAELMGFQRTECASDLYYPKEEQITCIAECKDVWKIKVFDSNVSALLSFLNDMNPRQAQKITVASILRAGNIENKTPAYTALSVIYPAEECECKK